jgi:ferrous iron transport protein B
MPAVAAKTFTIALLGNPNTGKSTLFNALAGARQRVGNYPGVTVEKKVGTTTIDGRKFTLIDLPGTYSLAPRSPDEMVTVDVLLGRRTDVPRPDAILCIVDASNLERNLYLVSQALELGLPVVVALNMVDLAEAGGVEIAEERLSRQLGVPVIKIQAHRRVGIDKLRAALAGAVERSAANSPSPFPEAFQREVEQLSTKLAAGNGQTPRYLVERLLLDTSGYLAGDLLNGASSDVRSALEAARSRLADAGSPVPAVEAIARYQWVGRVLQGVVQRHQQPSASATDRIDRILCHKLWGTLIFAALMVLVFQAVFSGAEPAMKLIEDGFGALSDAVKNSLEVGPLRSLLVDGIIAGVGGVIVFLPQIIMLFFFIAILEDCGYMARAAYLMDKLMVRVGLSGKSFIPLLSSFACAIPGVMAARVIENRRDRLITILVAPLMSCSARLPVYTILIAAFIPATALVEIPIGRFSLALTLPGLTLFAMYLVGIVAAVIVALVLRRTILKGETPPFIMELPTYKWPSLRTVFFRIVDRSWGFIRRAGTLILAVSILIWAALYYPRRAEIEREYVGHATRADTLSPQDGTQSVPYALDDPEVLADGQRNSILGTMGKAIEPVVRPLGWDWRIGCAAIASCPAREVVVATLGVIFNQGPEVDVDEEESAAGLRAALVEATWDGTDQKLFNVPVALSIMVFFALCAQCAATLAVIKRETNSWRWPIFTFTYMTGLAYVAALATYQIGMLL